MGKLLNLNIIASLRQTIFPIFEFTAIHVFFFLTKHTVYPKKYAHGFCFVVVIHWLIFPYPSGLLHWHCGNLTIAPVPAKQPWWIWINTSCEFIMNDCITTTKQSTTKPCAYFLGYTVLQFHLQHQFFRLSLHEVYPITSYQLFLSSQCATINDWILVFSPFAKTKIVSQAFVLFRMS